MASKHHAKRVTSRDFKFQVSCPADKADGLQQYIRDHWKEFITVRSGAAPITQDGSIREPPAYNFTPLASGFECLIHVVHQTSIDRISYAKLRNSAIVHLSLPAGSVQIVDLIKPTKIAGPAPAPIVPQPASPSPASAPQPASASPPNPAPMQSMVPLQPPMPQPAPPTPMPVAVPVLSPIPTPAPELPMPVQRPRNRKIPPKIVLPPPPPPESASSSDSDDSDEQPEKPKSAPAPAPPLPPKQRRFGFLQMSHTMPPQPAAAPKIRSFGFGLSS